MISKPVLYLCNLFEKYLSNVFRYDWINSFWTLFTFIHKQYNPVLQTKIEWKPKMPRCIFVFFFRFVYSTMQCGLGYLTDTKHVIFFYGFILLVIHICGIIFVWNVQNQHCINREIERIIHKLNWLCQQTAQAKMLTNPEKKQ